MSRRTTTPLYVAPPKFRYGIASDQRHRSFKLCLKYFEGTFGAFLSARSKSIEIGAPNTACICAQRHCLDDVVATTDAAVTYYFEAIA